MKNIHRILKWLKTTFKLFTYDDPQELIDHPIIGKKIKKIIKLQQEFLDSSIYDGQRKKNSEIDDQIKSDLPEIIFEEQRKFLQLLLVVIGIFSSFSMSLYGIIQTQKTAELNANTTRPYIGAELKFINNNIIISRNKDDVTYVYNYPVFLINASNVGGSAAEELYLKYLIYDSNFNLVFDSEITDGKIGNTLMKDVGISTTVTIPFPVARIENNIFELQVSYVDARNNKNHYQSLYFELPIINNVLTLSYLSKKRVEDLKSKILKHHDK